MAAGAVTNWIKSNVVQAINTSVGASATATADLDVTGYSCLTVWWQLQATTTTTDLTAFLGFFAGDGATVNANGLPAVRSAAAASDGTNVNQTNQYDIRGITKIRVNLKNNNVGSKTGVATIYLSTG